VLVAQKIFCSSEEEEDEKPPRHVWKAIIKPTKAPPFPVADKISERNLQ